MYEENPPAPATVMSQGVRVRRRRRTRPVVAATLVVGTMAASAALSHQLWPPSQGSVTAAAYAAGDGPDTGLSSAAGKVSPALVDINTTFGYQGAAGAGTGIVLTSTGEILTNNHVINGATSIRVTDVGNGRTYSARVVGYDAADDVAVLKLAGASGLRTATIGNSDAVKVGQPVVAVGNAGGTGGTPSSASGSVTALNQAITASDQLDGTTESLSGLIQTDAAVQPGDSGGPLVDSSGRVIGVDSAASQSYSLQSAVSSPTRGYAIPISKALAIAGEIEAGRSSGSVHIGSTPFLGVLISPATSAVQGVVSGSPAEQIGLSQGDVITGVDGRSVTSSSDLSRVLGSDRVGQSVSLSWTDIYGQNHTATATLAAGPPA